MKINIDRSFDDEIVVTVRDGRRTHLIVHVTHDDCGWTGMDAVESTVRELGRVLGVKVEYCDG